MEEAAGRLAAILREENADVLTVYDNHGGYGHPDHVQVHVVGVRAAELAGTKRVYESTMNRDFIRDLMERRADEMPDAPDAPDAAEMADFGSPAEIITTTVDVSDFVDDKRAAMAAHASQIPARLLLLGDARRRVPPGVRRGVVHPPRRARQPRDLALRQPLSRRRAAVNSARDG